MASILMALKALVKKVGGELQPDSKTHKHRFRIYGSKGNPYIVAFRNGPNVFRWECECGSWISKKVPCKHLRPMAPVLNAIAADPLLKPYLGTPGAAKQLPGRS